VGDRCFQGAGIIGHARSHHDAAYGKQFHFGLRGEWHASYRIVLYVVFVLLVLIFAVAFFLVSTTSFNVINSPDWIIIMSLPLENARDLVRGAIE
jgi:hypothetical protein